MEFYIGIDLGTSACKFLLVDGDGKVRDIEEIHREIWSLVEESGLL